VGGKGLRLKVSDFLYFIDLKSADHGRLFRINFGGGLVRFGGPYPLGSCDCQSDKGTLRVPVSFGGPYPLGPCDCQSDKGTLRVPVVTRTSSE